MKNGLYDNSYLKKLLEKPNEILSGISKLATIICSKYDHELVSSQILEMNKEI